MIGQVRLRATETTLFLNVKSKIEYLATAVWNWFFSSRKEEYSDEKQKHSNDLNLSDQLTQDKKAEDSGEEGRASLD
jgi:hypothetical protein